MQDTMQMQLIRKNGSTICFNKVYIYDNNQITFQGGTFIPVNKAVAIIFDKTDVDVKAGEIVTYNDKKRVVISVCDNRKRAKLKPHIKLTLQ